MSRRDDPDALTAEVDLAAEFDPFGGRRRARESSDFDDDGPLVDDRDSHAFQRKPVRVPLAFALVAALAGAWFAGVSTADFVSHLDRDVHAIHCALAPGAKAELGESGCRTVMLSPYSSWFRESWWGGIPVSLFAFAVFAFLAYRSAHLLARGRAQRSEAFFLLAATALPVVMSSIYAYLAVYRVGSVCTVCTGMYIASGAAFVGALVAFLMAERPAAADGSGPRRFALGFGEGCAFVGALALVYVGFVPEAEADKGAAGCGTLVQPGDPASVMVSLSATGGGTPAIELLDPLCPSCRAFDSRLAASGLDAKLSLRGVLFPLDSSCNWMVPQSLHPGACAVSEAVLCAAGKAERPGNDAAGREVLEWAFANQEALLDLAKNDEPALRKRLVQQFPAVDGCLGGTVVKNKLVKSLRWAVENALPVLTPQLFVNGTRMCDEDTDLGLEYTLSRMLAKGGAR